MLSCFTNSAPCGIELSVSFLSAVDICIWKLIWTQYLSAVDSVLSLTNSPYHEVSDVVISEGATFSIPNGGIIFNDDYDHDAMESRNVRHLNRKSTVLDISK
eukprot:258030_1